MGLMCTRTALPTSLPFASVSPRLMCFRPLLTLSGLAYNKPDTPSLSTRLIKEVETNKVLQNAVCVQQCRGMYQVRQSRAIGCRHHKDGILFPDAT